MKYKLKHLSKFCCKPANELEFEAVKMAAELGGFEFNHTYKIGCGIFRSFKEEYKLDSASRNYLYYDQWKQIPVLYFIKKLRMTEEEAEKIEDNRINLTSTEDEIWHLRHDNKAFYCEKGYEWRPSKDKREVTLIKIEQ